MDALIDTDKPSVQVRKVGAPAALPDRARRSHAAQVLEAAAIVLGLQPVKSRRGRQFMIVSMKAARVCAGRRTEGGARNSRPPCVQDILRQGSCVGRLAAAAKADAGARVSEDGMRALKVRIANAGRPPAADCARPTQNYVTDPLLAPQIVQKESPVR